MSLAVDAALEQLKEMELSPENIEELGRRLGELTEKPVEEYRAVPIDGTHKYYVIRNADSKTMAILEDRDRSEVSRGWHAWTWDEGMCLLRGAYAGGTLEYVLSVADDWL